MANIAPDAVVLTDKRLIHARVSVLGRFDFIDYVWRELGDAKLAEGILGATFTARSSNGQRISVDYLPKAEARAAYRYAQSKEEESLAERRRMALEEKHAASGATTIAFAGAPVPSAHINDDPVEKLKKLKQMLDAELITQGEYDAKKTSLLAEM